MNEKTKSLIRHLLTALGTVVGLIGLNGFVPVLDFLAESLDQVWDSVVVVLGFVTTVLGFLKNKERLEPK